MAPYPMRAPTDHPQDPVNAGIAGGPIPELFKRGVALHQQGRWAEARATYEAVLEGQPQHVEALQLLGVLAAQAKNYVEAIAWFDRAIAGAPSVASVYNDRGIVLKEQGKLDQALESYDKAIQLNPKFVEAYNNRGILFLVIEDFEGALKDFDRAISLNPHLVDVLQNRGVALHGMKRLEAALESYEAVIRLNPRYVAAWNNRGVVLQGLKNFEEAISSFNAAIRGSPSYAEAYNNRGSARVKLRQFEGALADFDQAIQMKPDYVEAHNNRALVLKELRRFSEAFECYEQAKRLKPDFYEAYLSKAYLNLLVGHLGDGFADYEYRRFGKGPAATRPRQFPQPLWLGEENLAGKTILLHAEQGFGDTIQFCRYVKLVASLGARVILDIPRPLLSLLRGLDGVHEWVPQGEAHPPFDFQCPLMSLPRAFKTTLESIPSAKQYLRADPRKVQAWQARLGQKVKPRVGLVWSGNPADQNDAERSLPLAELLPFLRDDCSYVCLQKELREGEAARLAQEGKVSVFCADLEDFSDTAALAQCMDLVISVDTSVAHLAGALGKPTWVLLPYIPEWRWLLDRRDSPWYPSVVLYRQDESREWKTVLLRLFNDLKSMAGALVSEASGIGG